MKKVKSSGTRPELMLRKALEDYGVAIDDRDTDLPGKPDIVIYDKKIAIFVDGDFWHGNQWRLRGLKSLEDQFRFSENKGYWGIKIRKNMVRDSKVTYHLFESGWLVIRLWESQIEGDLNACVEQIVKVVQGERVNSFKELLSEKSFAEFFAGIGLVRYSLESMGWTYKFANDLDLNKKVMYEGHFGPDEKFLLDDIHNIHTDQIPSVTLATASFPCNDLSLAGARQGLNDGKQSSAFWGFIKVLNEMGPRRPPLVLLENVTGFLSSKNGEDFRQALLALNDLGYQVDSFILDAANFVPQSRKRLFVVGVNKSVRQYRNSFALFNESNTRPEALIKFILNHPEIDWAIRDLPSQPKLQRDLPTIIENIPDDSNEWWAADRSEYLFKQMNSKHRSLVENLMTDNKWSYATVFRRVRNKKTVAEVRFDGIAGCLRTPRGGSGRQILIKAGYGKLFARLLNPNECARLMGVDDFKIEVGFNQALFGFGDAVCVPVISWIVEYYLDPLINELLHIDI